ncbi:phage holin family protein [uncultured Jatrophihabitans sp.]|uniref:phage holin family protein n=1 Tax=uncultured Jatrophihabitans sp. TaxID=1610747 RepID=UPI0035CA12B4
MTASNSTAPKPTPQVGTSAAPATERPSTTPATTSAEPSIGDLVHTVLTESSNLLQKEIALAKLELRATVKNAGTGAGMFAAAAVVLVFSLTFGFFALAEGIAALGLDRWLAFLIVFVAQLVVVGALVFLGIKKIKKAKAPERTIRTTKETVDYLKQSRNS